MYHDDLSFDVVLNPDDFTLFYKQKVKTTYIYKFNFKATLKYKKAQNQ